MKTVIAPAFSPCISAALLLGLGTLVPDAHSQAITISFDTSTAAGWTATAGDNVNATPFQVNFDSIWNPGLQPYLSISSTGDEKGTFLNGESLSQFDGFWLLDYHFFLPSSASGAVFTYSRFFADDRAVLTVNGVPIVATGINLPESPTTGGPSMVLTDGGPLQPYSFVFPNGSISGSVASCLNIGGDNEVEVIVNNTFNGIYGPAIPLNNSGNADDQALVGLSAIVTYSVPEPSVWALMFVGTAAVSLRFRRLGGALPNCIPSTSEAMSRNTLREEI